MFTPGWNAMGLILWLLLSNENIRRYDSLPSRPSLNPYPCTVHGAGIFCVKKEKEKYTIHSIYSVTISRETGCIRMVLYPNFCAYRIEAVQLRTIRTTPLTVILQIL